MHWGDADSLQEYTGKKENRLNCHQPGNMETRKIVPCCSGCNNGFKAQIATLEANLWPRWHAYLMISSILSMYCLAIYRVTASFEVILQSSLSHMPDKITGTSWLLEIQNIAWIQPLFMISTASALFQATIISLLDYCNPFLTHHSTSTLSLSQFSM